MPDTFSQLIVEDYLVFSIVLCMSAAIGIYFACAGKGQKTDGEYLMAGRSMGFFPVTLSLLASYLSAISLLGIPAEMYLYGTQWFLCAVIGYCAMSLVMVFIVLPVIYPLKLTSVFEYLEQRYHPVVRILVTSIYVLHNLMYIGIVLYAPALALDAVTGLSWQLCVVVISVLCTVYTTLGGLKAVIWTDAFQLFVMFVGLVAIIIKASLHFEGLGEVYDRMLEGDRIEFFNMGSSPTLRTTLWSGSLGFFVIFIYAAGLSQPFAQRYFSCTSLATAKTAAWLNCFGFIIMTTLCIITGSSAYAYYKGCDPLTSGRIDKPDQILALLVMELMTDLKGFAGLFIASIFCACLSTLSSFLNSLAAIVIRDIIYPLKKLVVPKQFVAEHNKPSDETGSRNSKIIAASFGVIALGMAFLASVMGNILQVTFSFILMIESAPMALFLMGMLLSFVNWKGAVFGLIVGELFGIWLGIGSFLTVDRSIYRAVLSASNCTANYTGLSDGTLIIGNTTHSDNTIYHVSYYLQGVISFSATIIVGCVVSLLTGCQDRTQLRQECIHPCFRKPSGETGVEKIELVEGNN